MSKFKIGDVVVHADGWIGVIIKKCGSEKNAWWVSWKDYGATLWEYEQNMKLHMDKAEQKSEGGFKIGDRVREDYSGDIGYITRKHNDIENAFWVAWETGYDAGEECWVYACEILPHIKEQNKTAEDIAPNLWSAYKDKLNDEALAALRELIEDVDNHSRINFHDSRYIDAAFDWEASTKGYDFWADVSNSECDKPEDVEVNGLTQEAASILGLTQKADTGSAADSIHYNSLDIQPIELLEMMLTKEEFQGFLKGNILKYSMRKGHKPGESETKDAKKAKQYKMWLELSEQGVTINPREHVV